VWPRRSRASRARRIARPWAGASTTSAGTKLRRWLAISLPSQAEPDLGRADPRRDAPPDEGRRHRVVDATDAHEGIAAGPRLEPQVGVRQRLGQPVQRAALDVPALDDPGAGAAQDAPEGDLGCPGIVLGLQVGQVTEVAQRAEAGLEVADGALGVTLALRPPRLEDDRLGAQRAEQGRHLRMQPRSTASLECLRTSAAAPSARATG
jgi:hypothetical protein